MATALDIDRDHILTIASDRTEAGAAVVLRRAFYDGFWQEAAASVGASCEAWDFGYHRIARNVFRRSFTCRKHASTIISRSG